MLFILNRRNVHELQAYAELASSLGVRTAGILRLYPLGRVKQAWGDLALSLQEMTKALDGLRAPEGLRIDLLGTGVRVVSVDPGLVETEFGVVRFRGDERRAAAAYERMTPLSADDVAEVVVFAATRPPHVNVAEVLVLPVDQAGANFIHRKQS